MKYVFTLFICILMTLSNISAHIDLESRTQSFVLESMQIIIPGHPHAFNPSIVRWNGNILMGFREILPLNFKSPWSVGDNSCYSSIWIVALDDQFSPISTPQQMPLGNKGRTDDARLISVNNRLYLIYSDNRHEVNWDGGYRMFIAELSYIDGFFNVEFDECLEDYPGKIGHKREKNWVPFAYWGSLLLAYSISPHNILLPNIGFGCCEDFCRDNRWLSWKWGDLRGGTPAHLIDSDNYIAFFHSCQDMVSEQSNGETMLHYFIGAYTFSSDPPFEITKMSPNPIIGKGFYSAPFYEYYWKPVKVVFPCGFIFDDNFFWLSFGKQDHELWIAKIDRKRLLESLIDVSDSK